MKSILRQSNDEKSYFIIERSAFGSRDPEEWPPREAGRYALIRIDTEKRARPLLVEDKESFFSHMPYASWEQYHTGDDPVADKKIKEVADHWGIEL